MAHFSGIATRKMYDRGEQKKAVSKRLNAASLSVVYIRSRVISAHLRLNNKHDS